MLEYIGETYKPDLLLVGMPTTDEFQHQFLGLVSPTLPDGGPNPALDDLNIDGVKDNRVAAARGVHPDRLRGGRRGPYARSQPRRQGPDDLRRVRPRLRPAVPRDRRQPAARRARPALDGRRPANCRPATGETIGKAKACWAGGAVQIYLNLAGATRPAADSPRSRRPTSPQRSPRSRPSTSSLDDTNDWNHDGQAEDWKVIDRVFTQAEARYIPNGPGSTTDMAYPTRTGDVVAFSYPPYQFDAATPGTLIAPSLFYGQHGYVPDVQDLADNINMRATFLGGGTGVAKATVTARSIDLAPTLAFMLGIPEPQHSQGRVLLDVVKGGNAYKPISIVGLNDFHGQLDQTTLARDGMNTTVGGAAFLATMFDEELASLPGPGLILAGGDNVGASPPNSALLQDIAGDRRRERVGPGRHVLRQPRVRLRGRAAADAPGAGELPVPGHEHHRGRDRRAARLGHAIGRLQHQRHPGRRDRGGAGGHARARVGHGDRRA